MVDNRRKCPRTCVACRKEATKRELLRIVKSPEGKVLIDLSGKAPGRGAYICKLRKCAEKAKKTNALSRALKIRVPETLYEQLMDFFNEEGMEK